MASKENLYQIGKNLGRMAAAGAALYGGIYVMENRGGVQDFNQHTVVQGQVLTDAEIANLRNYEALLAITSKVESTATSNSVPSPTPPTAEPSQKMEMMSVAQMTAEQSQLIEKYKAELPDILTKINADLQQVEDLTMYYPVYRAGQDRYGVPWELTWIIHQEESSVSRNKAAFESSIHYGAMQRAVQFHSIEDRDRANVGLEFLAALPVRHFDDAAEIILADAEIAEWAGPPKDYQKALFRYSAAGPAAERFQRFEQLEAVLGN